MKKKSPLVSVVILNWNGKKWLQKCLPTLVRVTYPKKEIIVVNNGSTDDSYEYIKKYYPQIKVVELEKNVGYAAANNVGAKKAKGTYILFLNNDTVLTPDFLEPLVEDLAKDQSIGAVQPQMRSLIYPELMDSVGSFFTNTGFLYHFGYMKPFNNPLYQKRMYTYSLKGSCFLMRKKDYIDLGGLDEDFVCYVEETDLCHRIWLSGKKVLYEPKSLMYHWGGGDMLVMMKNEVTMFRSFRNRFYSYYKNFGIVELAKLIPLHIIFCELYVLASLLRGNVRNAWGAQLGMLVGLGSFIRMMDKRNFVQNQIRQVSDAQLMPYIRRNPKVIYYYYASGNIKKFIDD